MKKSSRTSAWLQCLFASGVLLAVDIGATAQDLGRIVAAKQQPLPVYAQPGNPTPSGTVPVTNLPWPINAAENEFFRVKVDGKEVWIDSLDVRAERQSAHHCTKVPGPKDTAGSPGAAGKSC
jgi:hypothetical protein